MACLCGCGADNQHCHLPNRPPSPNTFYETFWLPTFTRLLDSSLREIRKTNEPSKRIQWRKIFGGDAQDKSPPRYGRLNTTQVLDGIRDGRPPSPTSSTSASEKIKAFNEQSYEYPSLSDRGISMSTHPHYSGLYSPPLDSCHLEPTGDHFSQASTRQTLASNLRSIRDRLRKRAGLDEPTFLNLRSSPPESQNGSLYWRSPSKLSDSPPLPIPLNPFLDSAGGRTQPSKSQETASTQIKNQDRYDVLVQPDLHNLSNRPAYGRDAQDIVPSGHKWENPLAFSDSSRGGETPIPRLPTSNFEEINEKLMQDWYRNLPLPYNEEENPQIPISPPKRIILTPSFGSQEPSGRDLVPNAFDKPVPDPPMELVTHTLPFQLSKRYPKSCTPPFHGQHDLTKKSSPVKRYYVRRPTSRMSSKPKRAKKWIRGSVRRGTEVVDSAERLKEQAANARAYLSRGCLCGCGGDNLQCLRSNRPRSPNTLYENFWAPNFAYMLITRLEAVAQNLEPSKRIWWREEFGGCAQDREPEIWDFKGDRENVLRKSPPSFVDDNYGLSSMNEERLGPSAERHRSISRLNTPIRSPDEATNTSLQDLAYGRVHASKGVPLYETGERSTKGFANH